MAPKKPKKSSKAKVKTSSKSTNKVGAPPPAAKNKMKKARNTCCPLVSWKCEEVPGPRKKESMYNEAKGKYETFYKATAPVTKCAVRKGSHTRSKLSVEEKDKVLDAWKKTLTENRCQYVEVPWPEKKSTGNAKGLISASNPATMY